MARVSSRLNVGRVNAERLADLPNKKLLNARLNWMRLNASKLNYTPVAAQPGIASIAPTTGASAGGTAITITGTNFKPGAKVFIGGTAATAIVIVNATTITAVTPAHYIGGASVVVVNPDGQTRNLANAFTYTSPAVTVASVAPGSGPTPGGTLVTITGTNFVAGAWVTFGAFVANSVVVVNATTITARTPPAGAGFVSVTVRNPDGQTGTRANAFAYIAAPAVTSVAPPSGPFAGGTSITITGTGFLPGATVSIGDSIGLNVVVVNATTITARTAPSSWTGAAVVTVRNADGQYGTLAAGFTFTGPASCAVWLKIGGVWTDISRWARLAGASITQALNEVPDTAKVRINGSLGQPLKGQEIKFVGIDGATMFAGHVMAARVVYEELPQNVAYDCDCIDYTWTFNQKKATVRYTTTSATDILVGLITTYAPGFSAGAIPAGLAVLDEITFTNETLSQAISRTCERIGYVWYVDYTKVIRVFTGSSVPIVAAIAQWAPGTTVDIAQHTDLSPVATLIRARGGGAGASVECAAGQTTIPIDDASWYSTTGGMIESGPQRMTYTGIVAAAETGSTMGAIINPALDAYWTFAINSPGGSGFLPGGTYWVGFSFVTGAGETLVTARQFTVAAGTQTIVATCVAVPTDPAIQGYRPYISATNGAPATMRTYDGQPSTRKFATVGVPALTEFSSVPANDSTHPLAPTINSAGQSAATIPAGSSTVAVDDLAPFPPSGWATAPGGQMFRYSGKSAATGAGLLTGIPPTGPGSITAPIKSGTIKSAPHLTGIPASGAGAIRYPIAVGDEVLIVVERSDAAAIAALQALIGGDGITEEFLTDGRLGLKELTARADALLAYRKDPLLTVTFESRDPAINVGGGVAINLTSPPIVGTFLVQRVQISEFIGLGSIGRPHPKRQIEASSRRFTFEDLVQQMKLLGRIN